MLLSYRLIDIKISRFSYCAAYFTRHLHQQIASKNSIRIGLTVFQVTSYVPLQPNDHFKVSFVPQMFDSTTDKPISPSSASIFISIFEISYPMLLWPNSSLFLAVI